MSKIRVSQELQLPKEASVAEQLEYSKPAWTEEMGFGTLYASVLSGTSSDFISQSALSLFFPE